MVACFSISARFTAKFELVFVQHRKTLFLRGFILKPTGKAQDLLKNGTRDFYLLADFANSVPYQRIFDWGTWFLILFYEYNKSRKMYQLCLFLTAGSLYFLLDLCVFFFVFLFFFLKMTNVKTIKEEIQNNTRVWTNPR